jgi:hypothetical protein
VKTWRDVNPCATPDVERSEPAGSLQRHPLSEQAESTTSTTMSSRVFATRRCQHHLVAGTLSLEDLELPAVVSLVGRAPLLAFVAFAGQELPGAKLKPHTRPTAASRRRSL